MCHCCFSTAYKDVIRTKLLGQVLLEERRCHCQCWLWVIYLDRTGCLNSNGNTGSTCLCSVIGTRLGGTLLISNERFIGLSLCIQCILCSLCRLFCQR